METRTVDQEESLAQGRVGGGGDSHLTWPQSKDLNGPLSSFGPQCDSSSLHIDFHSINQCVPGHDLYGNVNHYLSQRPCRYSILDICQIISY